MVEFKPRSEGGRRFVMGLFAIWGVIGLALALFAMMGAPILTAIYVTLMWIGGVLFFGLCVLMSDVIYRLNAHGMPVYVVDKPREDGLNQQYRGVPFMRLDSGYVIAEFEDGKHTFKNWKKFLEAVPDD